MPSYKAVITNTGLCVRCCPQSCILRRMFHSLFLWILFCIFRSSSFGLLLGFRLAGDLGRGPHDSRHPDQSDTGTGAGALGAEPRDAFGLRSPRRRSCCRSRKGPFGPASGHHHPGASGPGRKRAAGPSCSLEIHCTGCIAQAFRDAEPALVMRADFQCFFHKAKRHIHLARPDRNLSAAHERANQ